MIPQQVHSNRTSVRLRSGRNGVRRDAAHSWQGSWSRPGLVRPHAYGRVHIDCLEWRQQEESFNRFMAKIQRLSSS